jgi:hypothetical protein
LEHVGGFAFEAWLLEDTEAEIGLCADRLGVRAEVREHPVLWAGRWSTIGVSCPLFVEDVKLVRSFLLCNLLFALLLNRIEVIWDVLLVSRLLTRRSRLSWLAVIVCLAEVVSIFVVKEVGRWLQIPAASNFEEVLVIHLSLKHLLGRHGQLSLRFFLPDEVLHRLQFDVDYLNKSVVE